MKNLIVIPDIHQDFYFFNYIIEKHKDEDVKFLCLGDYFDPREKGGNYKTNRFCEYLLEIYNSNLDITFLAGNHDIQYFEVIEKMKITKKKYVNFHVNYKCSDFSGNRAKKINSIFKNISFFNDLNLFYRHGDFLFSHAGFHPYHVSFASSVEKCLPLWEYEWFNFKKNISSKYYNYNRVWNIGACRGGEDIYGSPLWLDFFDEFRNIDGVRQVVGHTSRNEEYRKKEISGNICLDNRGTTYGYVKDDDIEILDIYS